MALDSLPPIELDPEALEWLADRVIQGEIVARGLLVEGAPEGYHHHVILPKTLPLLSREAIEADPVGSVVSAIKADVNLLSQFESMKARTLLEAPDTDLAEVRERVFDLLYGDDDLATRVGRMVALGEPRKRADGANMSINATVASYLLGLSQPDRYAFCKPTVYRSAAKALLGEAVGSGDPAGRVAHATAFYQATLDALRDDFGVEFDDLLHVHIAFYVATTYPDGGWAAANSPVTPPSDAEHRDAADALVPDVRQHVEQQLSAFAEVADDWFEEWADLGDYHAFFERFVAPDHLAALEWPDVQAVGAHLHSMQSLALARANAFGNPNHPIEHYRQSFEFLARGDAPLADRLDRMRTDPDVRLMYVGESALGEMAGHLFSDRASLFNDRSQWAVEFLGLPREPGGRSFGARFVDFAIAVAPVVALYQDVVGARTDWPIRLEVDQFFSWLYETERNAAEPPVEDDASRSVWLIAPGRKARFWERCYEAGEITIGWDDLGDLAAYDTSEGIAGRLTELRATRTRQTNNARACWEFAHVIRTGDWVIAKDGRSTILGVGRVTSDYRYEPDRPVHRHVRDVDWILQGRWDTGERMLPMKTMTGISKYPDMVAELFALVGMPPPVREPKHWWLNCNPSVWSLSDAEVGHVELYTAQNEAGNNRQKYAHFQAVRPGDLVVGYESTPAKQVVALCRVTRSLFEMEDGTEAIEIEKTDAVENGRSWGDLRSDPALAGAEPVQNNQGSLFALTAEQYRRITDPGALGPKPYTAQDAALDAFAEPSEIVGWVDLLRRRKNVILQGPPGVGKTFLARRLAWALMGEKADSRVQMVQFHQSYAYEDFVQGFRPSEGGSGFALRDGVFYTFVESALEDPDRDYVFIIDEVNRGNLSKIFGELMLLIEPDKRSYDFAIPLTYAPSGQRRFHVPPNVHILGLMNTADRSLAVVDYALRRRFAFVTLDSAVTGDRFRQWLVSRGAAPALADRVAARVGALNAQIRGDSDLGAGFCVGHSYFCPPAASAPDDGWYRRVVETEVGPLLAEYWFDRPAVSDAAVRALLG